MRRPVLGPVVIVPTVLVLLIGGYMGAYYVLLTGVEVDWTRGRPDDPFAADEAFTAPLYRWVDKDLAAPFFWPAHQIDRRLRPGYWEPTWIPGAFHHPDAATLPSVRRNISEFLPLGVEWLAAAGVYI